jgi:hypothetical protein
MLLSGIPVQSEVRKVVFAQFSDLLLTADRRMREYYLSAYGRMRGYHYPTHFMEIPYWIPILASSFRSDDFERELLVIDDQDKARQRLEDASDDTTFFFSVLDANVEHVRELAKTGARMLVGGYTDPADLAEFPNVEYLNAPEDVVTRIHRARPPGVLDYELFRELACIPRFSLSTGCSFRCAFCTVPTKLVEADPARIRDQVGALEPLDFDLVFMDDKSFGDAKNWTSLGEVGDHIREINPGFFGFIVQMPPSLAARPGFLEQCRDLGVRYVEFGVETADDELLRYLRKPFRLRHLERACEIVRDLGMYAIPNLIIGIPGDTYTGTLSWLADNVDIVPVVNVNWLALHHGNERGGLPLEGGTTADGDQNSSTKTWLSDTEEARGWETIDRIYRMTEEHWSERAAYAC